MNLLEHFLKTIFSNPTNLPKCVLKELKNQEDGRRRIIGYTKVARVAEKLMEEFRDMFPPPNNYSAGIMVSIGYETFMRRGVNLHVDTKDFKTLLPLRKKIRQLGFPAPKVDDCGETRTRIWEYGDANQGTGIRLCGHLPYEQGEGCKYVQVGVEERPVFELHCGPLNGEEEIKAENKQANT